MTPEEWDDGLSALRDSGGESLDDIKARALSLLKTGADEDEWHVYHAHSLACRDNLQLAFGGKP